MPYQAAMATNASDAASPQPFAGVRIIDLTHVLAGPFCTYQFALLGADVIKIEAPDRPDCARFRGPDDDLNARALGINYQVQASNKRSLALDIARPEGMAILEALLADADVLVDNYRPGALAALGLDATALRRRHPRLVVCSITGHGDATPAYDNSIQAASGMMARTGSITAPVKAGASAIDYASGMTAAFAIAAALFRRAATGKGEAIDVAMFDTALTLMAPEAAAALRPGSPRPAEAGLGTYATADGHITLGVFTPAQSRRFWTALGHDGFAALADWPALWAAADAMRAELALRLRTRTAAQWEAWLHGLGLAGARVRRLADAVADPRLAARGFFHAHADVMVPVAAYRFAAGGPAVTAPSPAVGADSDAILAGLGHHAAAIAALREAGIVA
jgi:crotonobetainyl-CoA:carnitine CoA-transferase CaiB-like acyl-CoA transferase